MYWRSSGKHLVNCVGLRANYHPLLNTRGNSLLFAREREKEELAFLLPVSSSLSLYERQRAYWSRKTHIMTRTKGDSVKADIRNTIKSLYGAVCGELNVPENKVPCIDAPALSSFRRSVTRPSIVGSYYWLSIRQLFARRSLAVIIRWRLLISFFTLETFFFF